MREEILKVITNEPNEYGKYYINHFEKIFEYTRNIDGVKTDTFISDFQTELDKIRFSTVFSDFTNIIPLGIGKQDQGQLVVKENQEVTIDDSILKAVISENQIPVLKAGYIVRNENEIGDFLKTIEPLVTSERALLHNSRILIGLSKEKSPQEGYNTWQVFDVQPSSPVGNWLSINNASEQGSTTLNFDPKTIENSKEVFDITIPYLKGIPISELVKILDDHQDLISKFRTNLKQVVKESQKDNKSIVEMKNDIVRPEVDLISQKFKKIKNIHGLKVAGTTLSTITLGLVGYSTFGIGSIISGFLGAGGLGLLVKNEVDYQKEISQLQENPFYLMWKFKSEK